MKKRITQILVLITFLFSIQLANAQFVAGDMDPTFNTADPGNGKGDGANNTVYTTAIQADGKIIIGGIFTTFNGSTVGRIVRLNADGTLDPTFNAGGVGASANVYAIAIQTDGKIIIGGNFSAFNGATVGKIVRLNTDGTLDTTFNAGGAGASANVYAITIQTDGKILIGGDFITYNGTAKSRIARLNTDGSLDTPFTSSSPASVRAIAIQPSDGKILMGNFNFGVSTTCIIRLNTDGTVDSTFATATGIYNGVSSIAIQTDGKIIVGEGSTSVTSSSKKYITRLNANGSFDVSYTSGVGTGHYNSIAIQPDGKIIFGGSGPLGATATVLYYLTRLKADFTFDSTFNAGGTGIGLGTNAGGAGVTALALLSDGKIIVGGSFPYYNNSTANRIMRLNTNGSFDTTFNVGSGTQNTVLASTIQPNGKIIVGGLFRNFNDTVANCITRVNSNGSLDTTFNTGGAGVNFAYTPSTLGINAIALQSDGKIIIGGSTFSSYNGTAVGNIARLNSDGTLDTTFNVGGAGANGNVLAIAIQADGKIIIGGAFTSYNGTVVGRFARLKADGTLDTSFIMGTGLNNTVNAIAIQPDGKIVIVGTFTSYNGTTSKNRITRLNTDGTLDTAFNVGGTGSTGTISTIALQADGKIVIGGLFITYNGTSAIGITRLNSDGTLDTAFNSGGAGAITTTVVSSIAVQADGKIILGGSFTLYNTISANRIARLNTNGSLDTTFNYGTGASGTVNTIAIQSDSRIIIGGNFTSYKSIGKNRISRIFANNFTPIPTTSAQDFCSGATVANLVATGTALQWYAASTGGNALLSTDVLATGTYYVSQTLSTIESDRTPVAVTVGNTTTWNGSIWDNGTPTSISKAIIAGNFTATADLSACSLDVTGTAVVTVPTGFNFNISGAVTVANTASLTFENNTNLIQQGTINNNSGNVIVKRESSPLFRLDYTMWSSPVANQNLLTFSPDTNTSRFYSYNTTTDKFNVVVPSTTTFGTADGYLIRMPNTWEAYSVGETPLPWTGTFIGIPNNGDITYTMSTAGTGYNAVGNPYPSTLNIDTFITANTIPIANNIDGTLYFWRKTNDALNPTSYTTYTTAGVTGGNSHTYANDNFMSVGQGFIVKANSNTLNFNNSMRIANNQNQFFRTKAVERNRIWLNLSNSTATINQMMVAYMTNATAGIDVAIDGKYLNDSPTALNSLINNEEFAIQGRSLPFDATDVVPMSFKTTTAGDYSIAIDHVDGLFTGNQAVILVDNLAGIETDLKTTSYIFAASAGTDKTRFSLKYQKTLGINTPTFDENSVTIFKNKGTISIKSSLESIANVKVFDINGRLLFEKSKVNTNETNIESSKFTNQVLIVKITSTDNKIVNKKVIN